MLNYILHLDNEVLRDEWRGHDQRQDNPPGLKIEQIDSLAKKMSDLNLDKSSSSPKEQISIPSEAASAADRKHDKIHIFGDAFDSTFNAYEAYKHKFPKLLCTCLRKNLVHYGIPTLQWTFYNCHLLAKLSPEPTPP